MSGTGARSSLVGLAALALAACGPGDPSLPQPHVRVLEMSPTGDAVPVDAAFTVSFSGAVDPGETLTGGRVVLAPQVGRAAALEAVESEDGAAGLDGAVAVDAALEDGGRRLVLRPREALRGHYRYSLVVAARLLDASGRPVLDAGGRRRASLLDVMTGAPPGPPPLPAIVEVRVHAATPEAGGEYVEVLNLGEGPLDLVSYRLVKRTSSGATSSCLLDPAPSDAIGPGEVALVAGGAWDGRYPVPRGVPVLRCGSSALLGGLSDDHPPELTLLAPEGAAVSTFGAGGTAPICDEVAVRLDPGGPDAWWNLDCDIGSPGVP